MNTLVLWLTFSSFRIKSKFALLWPILLAMMAYSLEMQLATVLGANGFSILLAVNVIGLALVLLRRVSRRQIYFYFRSLGEFILGLGSVICQKWHNAMIFIALGGLLAMVLAKGLLFVPISVDPYHHMKVYHIESIGNLSHVPAFDFKVNVFNYSYELLLADLKHTPFVGDLLFRLSSTFAFFMLVLLILILYRQSGGKPKDFYLWASLLFLPVFFHQFMMHKNDFFAFLFAFGGMYLVFKASKDAGSEHYVLAGLLSGIAFSVKGTAFPLVIIGILFLPYGARRILLRSRALWGLGFLAGLGGGGFLLVSAQNLIHYGSLIGPAQYTGNLPTSIRNSAIQVFRFSISMIDNGHLTPQIWPGRGGWGGTYGYIFTLLLLICFILLISRRKAFRAVAISSVYFAFFSAAYPDADLAHRMALAPAFLIAIETIKELAELRGSVAPAIVARGALLVAMLVTYRSLINIGLDYLGEYELLNSLQQAANRLGLQDAYASTLDGDFALDQMPERFRMRVINRQLRGSQCVANSTQENYLALEGVPYTQLSIVVRQPSGGYQYAWIDEEPCPIDYFVVGPIDALPNPRLLERINACLAPEHQLTSVAGRQVPILGIPCRSDSG